VECLHCGARCNDWEHDQAHKFTLRTANLGGLLVFRCTACGATVRKKHFKDHMIFEMTPPGSGCEIFS
jgi:DNA-directed RNA polymerase subunit RPC12/RpoP